MEIKYYSFVSYSWKVTHVLWLTLKPWFSYCLLSRVSNIWIQLQEARDILLVYLRQEIKKYIKDPICKGTRCTSMFCWQRRRKIVYLTYHLKMRQSSNISERRWQTNMHSERSYDETGSFCWFSIVKSSRLLTTNVMIEWNRGTCNCICCLCNCEKFHTI
jgi:hypothetical protein